jgi:hypothetical protein
LPFFILDVGDRRFRRRVGVHSGHVIPPWFECILRSVCPRS